MKLLPPPGPERRTQLTRLGVMLVILVGLGIYQFGSTPDSGTPAKGSQATAPVATPAPSTLPQPVGLDKLEIVAEDEAAGRNPFGYGQRPPPPAPPTPPAPPPPPPGPPPPPPGPPPPPDIPLKLIGLSVLRTGEPTVATLRDSTTNAIFMATEGQVIDGRYRLAKVALTSVIVTYLDGSGQKMLANGGS